MSIAVFRYYGRRGRGGAMILAAPRRDTLHSFFSLFYLKLLPSREDQIIARRRFREREERVYRVFFSLCVVL